MFSWVWAQYAISNDHQLAICSQGIEDRERCIRKSGSRLLYGNLPTTYLNRRYFTDNSLGFEVVCTCSKGDDTTCSEVAAIDISSEKSAATPFINVISKCGLL